MIALGAVLILTGLAVLVVEAHIATAGVLGVAGVLAAAAGVGLVMAGAGATPLSAVPVAVVLAGLGLTATAVATRKVIVARGQAIRTGPSRLVGATASVRTWSGDEGQVAADGTLWRARLSWEWEDPSPLPGETVVVNELDGLTVSIRRPYPWEVDPRWAPSSRSS